MHPASGTRRSGGGAPERLRLRGWNGARLLAK